MSVDLRGQAVLIDYIDLGRGCALRRAASTPVLELISNDVVLTLPTSALTLATLTGTETLTNKTLTAPVIGAATGTSLVLTGSATVLSLLATADDSGALGASGTAFADLFLASGGVINWNAGNATLTHAAGSLTVGVTTLALGATNLTQSGSLTSTGRLTAGQSMSVGAGFAAAETEDIGVWVNGAAATAVIITTIMLDITGLDVDATDLVIVGDSPAAVDCHFGQITAALNGTITGGLITCLEAPAGASADLDFYSASVGTGPEGTAITDAALGTETALVTRGASWAAGNVVAFTGYPTANDYLYITNGAAAGAGAFTAGKFLIQIFGT